MNVSEIGLGISLLSVSVAVVKQSFDIKKFANPNGKYVKKDDCHEAHRSLEKFLDGKFSDTNKRIDDFIKATENYIDLLKK